MAAQRRVASVVVQPYTVSSAPPLRLNEYFGSVIVPFDRDVVVIAYLSYLPPGVVPRNTEDQATGVLVVTLSLIYIPVAYGVIR